MSLNPRSWLESLLGLAVLLVLAGLLLQWAVRLFRPLLPLFVIGALLFVIVKVIRWRQRYW